MGICSAVIAVNDAARLHGWSPVAHKIHDNVLGRGDERLIIGYSSAGKTVQCALFYPLGFGTGYIDDPTPCETVGGSGGDKLPTVLGWISGPADHDPLPATLVLVPCAARKLTRSERAREIYDSDHFRLTLRAAEARARIVGGRVMILSAKYGLLNLDRVISPYDVAMGQAGAIDAAWLASQLAVQHVRTVEALLPSRYLAAMRSAVELLGLQGLGIELVDLYRGAPGIGYQRAVLSSLLAS